MIKDKLTYISLVLVAMFWGGNFIAAKIAVSEIPPFTAGFLRFTLTAAILFSLVRATGAGVRVGARDLASLSLLGLVGVFGYNALFMLGMRTTTAVNGALIVAANPILTTALAGAALGEKITMRQLVGVPLSFFGVALVVLKGQVPGSHVLQANPGDLYLIAAMITWSFYSILIKKAVDRFSPLICSAYACATGAFFLFPFALFAERSFRTLPGVQVPAYLALAYMTIFASVVGMIWWNRGVAILGAGATSLFINLIPVFTMVISFFMGEKITISQFVGCCLVIGGVTVATGRRRAGSGLMKKAGAL